MRTRALTTILSVLLLAATALPATAQESEAYRATADAAGVELKVLDTDAIRISDAAATIDTAPLASARGLGLSLSEASRSQAEVTSRGASEQDGEHCLIPDLPAPLDSVLSLDQVCSLATVNLVDQPGAMGRASVAAAAVDGGPLAALLAQVALQPLTDGAGAAFDAVQDAVNGPVYDALIEACAAAAPVGDVITQLPLDQIPDELDPIADQFAQGEPCSILLSLIADPPVIQDGAYLTDLTDALEAAIAQVDGLALVIASQANGTATASEAGADATYTTVTAELPSLAFLSDVVDTVTRAVLQDFLDDLAARLEPVADVVGALPSAADTLGQFRDLLDLSILTDTDPLARLEVLGAKAHASFDRATGTVTTDGSAGLVNVTLSQALADLFGVERTQTIGTGQSITLLEGTPLESTVSVGTTETTDADHEGLPGKRVQAQAASLQLLTGAPGGGVSVALGTVSAAAFGRVGAAASGPPLPTTGGGASLAALAILAAGAVGRRRR